MRRRGSAKTVAAVAIGLLLAFVLYVLWQTFAYYRAIRAGEDVALPQYGSSLSVDPEAEERASAAASVARASLETSDDPATGADDAELVIVEFVDYECPFCKASSGIVRTMASRYGDRVRFIIRDYPVLELHPNALVAAEALGCAEEQGRYWEMHDRVFAENAELDRATLERLAAQSGLERGAFAACLGDHRRLDEIQGDVDAAVEAGVRGTPTFFFNGHRVEGSVPEAMFEELIKGFLNEI